MSLCPFEKIALDTLDRRMIEQLKTIGRIGRKALSAAGIGGRMVYNAGRAVTKGGQFAGRGVEMLGDQLIEHPTRTILFGVPLAYNMYKFPERLNKSLNNVHSENYYRYR